MSEHSVPYAPPQAETSRYVHRAWRALMAFGPLRQTWHTLREPLLKDIGLTRIDAEREMLQRSWGHHAAERTTVPYRLWF